MVAWLWAVAVPTAAWTAGAHEAPAAARLGAALVYVAGSALCHQRPERSLRVGAMPLPVCARCAGIYWGAAAVVLALSLGQATMHRPRPRPRRSQPALWRWAIVALAVNAGTLLIEWSGRGPGNEVRALAGLALGAVSAFIVWHATRPDWQSG